MRLYILHLGNCYVDKGGVLTPGLDVGTWWTIPIVGYLIQTDDNRNILVDTGMDKVHIEDPDASFGGTAFGEVLKVQMTEDDYVVNQLAKLGLAPEDIDLLIATHFHFDHAGNTRDFTASKIVVQRDCYDDIMRPDAPYPRATFDIPNLKWEIIDGDVEIAPRVTLLKTPGHVPGHMSVLLDLPETGKMVIGIDTIYVQDNLDKDNWGAYSDPDAARASAKKLQEIAARENAMLLYGHDPNQWKTLKKAPEYYS
jgi:N-acyl homoserine lactone hydrolase